ncbi:erythropoietin receptor [Dunckerocampus dactyliophorus]|uniref:erythropoietin receptor n=1 Tax=Dunckerocampus dactyliophorus TaxID=161453 RepID=UPI00240645A6|nr:erythropoietin receptor [Dunckerocampus dactyliophorus]
MTCDHLRKLLALSATVCAMRAHTPGVQVGRDFEKKVSIMLKEEAETPKCFAEGRKDFTCFWEEEEDSAGSVDQYSFTYNYQNENSSRCPLTVHRAHGGKRLLVCHLNRTQMFVQMDIQVHRETKLIHNRSLLVELVFLLDPPANVTVSTTGQQGQLNVSWVPPTLKYMDDSLMYEVSYATAESHMTQVEVVQASSEVILRGLEPGSKYKVRVRVKLDGISYNGYWSVWSEPVFMQTPPAELNLLIVFLTLIMFFILLVLSFTVLVSNRSFLIKKIWPTIPTPDAKFQGLFTDYGGDFQEWLKQTNGGLRLTPALFYAEDYPTSLEVLSELSLNPPPPTPPLPPKRSRAFTLQCAEEGMQKGLDVALTERWRTTTHNHWVMDCLRAQQQSSQSPLLESQDAYVTLTGNNHSQDDNNTLEESLPLEVLFPLKTTALSEAH